jgi:hypothetical protein
MDGFDLMRSVAPRTLFTYLGLVFPRNRLTAVEPGGSDCRALKSPVHTDLGNGSAPLPADPHT